MRTERNAVAKGLALFAAGAAVVAGLAGCGSSGSSQPATTSAAPATTQASAPTTTRDRAATLGPASRTTCGAFLAMNETDQQALIAKVIAENPKWQNFGAMTGSWAKMNCNGKDSQAIGVALEVNSATEPALDNVSQMTCARFLAADTDDDTGILLMRQFYDENPKLSNPGPFIELIMVRDECKKPGATGKTILEVAK